jgi:FKBP-type peptidyl-prolyl cis-trans isomerase SlyD
MNKYTHMESRKRSRIWKVASHAEKCVMRIAENTVVTIDGNHPLAGVNLNFAVTVRDVRQATPEETAHGHAH